jgi:hypothetical protein
MLPNKLTRCSGRLCLVSVVYNTGNSQILSRPSQSACVLMWTQGGPIRWGVVGGGGSVTMDRLTNRLSPSPQQEGTTGVLHSIDMGTSVVTVFSEFVSRYI